MDRAHPGITTAPLEVLHACVLPRLDLVSLAMLELTGRWGRELLAAAPGGRDGYRAARLAALLRGMGATGCGHARPWPFPPAAHAPLRVHITALAAYLGDFLPAPIVKAWPPSPERVWEALAWLVRARGDDCVRDTTRIVAEVRSLDKPGSWAVCGVLSAAASRGEMTFAAALTQALLDRDFVRLITNAMPPVSFDLRPALQHALRVLSGHQVERVAYCAATQGHVAPVDALLSASRRAETYQEPIDVVASACAGAALTGRDAALKDICILARARGAAAGAGGAGGMDWARACERRAAVARRAHAVGHSWAAATILTALEVAADRAFPAWVADGATAEQLAWLERRVFPDARMEGALHIVARQIFMRGDDGGGALDWLLAHGGGAGSSALRGALPDTPRLRPNNATACIRLLKRVAAHPRAALDKLCFTVPRTAVEPRWIGCLLAAGWQATPSCATCVRATLYPPGHPAPAPCSHVP